MVWLSIPTADVLLAEAMVAVALGANWHLTWWLWHVLMVLAFGYSAYVTYRREGGTRWLFDAVGTEATLPAVRAGYGSALEQLVAAVASQEAGELTPAEMSLITSGLAMRFGVSEGQPAALGRAAAALHADREQIEWGMPHASPTAHGERGTVFPTGDGAGTVPVSGSSAGGHHAGRGRRRWWSRRRETCRP